MALDYTKWSVDATTKEIAYDQATYPHGSAGANYVTVLELHRWLQDLADDISVVSHPGNGNGDGDEYVDITTDTPSEKQFDTIITLKNNYYISDTTAEFIYGGSIIQDDGGGEDIFDGVKVVANAGVTVNVIQNDSVLSNKFWNNVPSSGKTVATATVTGANSTKVLNVSDSSEFTAGDYITIGTVLDESYQVDEVINGTSIRLTETLATATSGGEAIYFAVRGINPSTSVGVALQFMVKTKNAGTTIDNGALIFTTREWYKTYSEFRIPSMSRGENVVPLNYVNDLNNTTPQNSINTGSFVAPFDGITNVSAGWNQIDVDQNLTDENYYSEWNRGSATINQFYEYMKYITRNGYTTTTYGIAGEQFRGITQSISFTGAATPSAFADGANLTWGTGATAGSAKVLAMDTVSHVAYIQLLTGVLPGTSVSVSDGTNSATTLGAAPTSDKAISSPVCGASTGSALVGAYGFSLEYADLSKNDVITALDGVARSTPNNQTFSFTGLTAGYYVLVGPNTGSDAFDFNQLTLSTTYSGATVTEIVVNEAIPANTPTSGTIRITRADGAITRHPYSAVNTSTKTFTITSHDFSSNNATSGDGVMISYIDRAATGATETYSAVQSGGTQSLYARVRFGGTGPTYLDAIKTFETPASFGSNGGTVGFVFSSDA